jgi:prepilin-type N-terminal cleavage/methylation domain-containing protein
MRISKPAPSHSNAGFTLFEMLIVIVIAGILALIAAPGWLSFANNRRAEAGRDQVLQVIRQTQAKALQTRRSQAVDFFTATNPPEMRVAGVSQPLGAQLPSAQQGRTSFGLAVVGNANTGCSTGATGCIVFDERGNVVTAEGEPPTEEEGIMKIVITSPAGSGAKRCVIVRTLLGAAQNGSGNECN